MLNFTPDPTACRVVGLWAFLPGALLAPFLFWQSFVGGTVFLIAWMVFSLYLLPLHIRSIRIELYPDRIEIRKGILFKFARQASTRFITGFSRMGTPLLRLCGSCAVILHTSGTALFLPAISDQNADQLLDMLGVGRL